MAVIDRINEDLKRAMRDRDRERVGALRLILSELQKAAKDGSDHELAVLRRERKRRIDAATAYRQAGREDLANSEEAEERLICAYLPAELSDEQLAEIVAAAILESGATSVKDMGNAMRHAMATVDGRADGRRVSTLVRDALAG